MKSLREKISFIITACFYVLFHVRLGPSLQVSIVSTLEQLMLTAPYAIGFAYMIAAFIRRVSDGEWPPWDRIARIYFTIGIFFAFFFALYEYAERGAPSKDKGGEPATGRLERNFPPPTSYLVYRGQRSRSTLLGG